MIVVAGCSNSVIGICYLTSGCIIVMGLGEVWSIVGYSFLSTQLMDSAICGIYFMLCFRVPLYFKLVDGYGWFSIVL